MAPPVRELTDRQVRAAAERLVSLGGGPARELFVYLDGSGSIVDPGMDHNYIAGGWDRFSVWSSPGRRLTVDEAVVLLRDAEQRHQKDLAVELEKARAAGDTDRASRIAAWLH